MTLHEKYSHFRIIFSHHSFGMVYDFKLICHFLLSDSAVIAGNKLTGRTHRYLKISFRDLDVHKCFGDKRNNNYNIFNVCI